MDRDDELLGTHRMSGCIGSRYGRKKAEFVAWSRGRSHLTRFAFARIHKPMRLAIRISGTTRPGPHFSNHPAEGASS